MSDFIGDAIDIEQILSLFKQGGPIASTLKEYEERSQQLEMIQEVIETYQNSSISLIEAGTGTGKSLAYLLPAILWALKNKKRTLISTNTITLQEQLILKDIPFITKALSLSFKACLVKGMSNYLCLRKLKDTLQELPTLLLDEKEEISQVDQWSQETMDGSYSNLDFKVRPKVWDRVNADADACSHSRCPYYKECFFFKARKEAEDAQILVVNHHLFFADILSRKERNFVEESGIVPFYDHIILDEAHTLEVVATEALASHFSLKMLSRYLARLTSENNKKEGKFRALKKKINDHYQGELIADIERIVYRLDVELIQSRRDLMSHFALLFEKIQCFFQERGLLEAGQRIQKYRMYDHFYDDTVWIDQIAPLMQAAIDRLQSYQQALSSIDQAIEFIQDADLDKKTQGLRADILSVGTRLKDMSATLKLFNTKPTEAVDVRWVEMEEDNPFSIVLKVAVLNLDTVLSDLIFNRFASTILCSATLATNQNFKFIRKQLGILEENSKPVRSLILDSPFDYQKQALLAVPLDMPDPKNKEFIRLACDQVMQAVRYSQGGAFILFTSFTMLRAFYKRLEKPMLKKGFNLFVQGNENRHLLLSQFKTASKAVLFGTDTFWEGVDVAGDALRLVIITKLPFQVPSEPMIQARFEKLEREGKQPFLDYALPNAIVKFKQGFGRLIRNKKDKGCILCLDSRLATKGYGKRFLNSLPDCKTNMTQMKDLTADIQEFYSIKR